MVWIICAVYSRRMFGQNNKLKLKTLYKFITRNMSIGHRCLHFSTLVKKIKKIRTDGQWMNMNEMPTFLELWRKNVTTYIKLSVLRYGILSIDPL